MTTDLSDRVVINEHGEKIGKVTDVLYATNGTDPRWAVVNPGPLAAAHYVPLRNAYTTNDGKVVVPYDREIIKHSPKASGQHVMTPDLEHDLTVHYALEDA
jgi:sporulation protein YlmC with PRC-barrel domain